MGDLLALTVARVTAPVEGMHRAIAHRWLGWTHWAGVPAWRMYDTLVGDAYEAIRLSGSMLGNAVGLGATIAGGNDGLRLISQSRKGSQVQAAINAIWGDELDRSKNELRIEMGMRDLQGNPVEIDSVGSAGSVASAPATMVVLVHGLGQTERCWIGNGSREETAMGLAEQLATDPSFTPVLVRYNTGRHVSENGVELAELLEHLWRSWPTPIERFALVGHSMGGLVIRSACHVGRSAGHGWVDRVGNVVTVASPHLGAPLEKAVNVLSWGLKIVPEGRAIADFLDVRSDGIKDLRFGAVVEEDWLGAEPDALLHNTVGTLPPLPGVAHHVVAAVVTSDPAHPLGVLMGDLMVRAASSTGRGKRRRIEATHVRVLGGRRHFDLLSDREVTDQILSWLNSSTGLSTQSGGHQASVGAHP